MLESLNSNNSLSLFRDDGHAVENQSDQSMGVDDDYTGIENYGKSLPTPNYNSLFNNSTFSSTHKMFDTQSSIVGYQQQSEPEDIEVMGPEENEQGFFATLPRLLTCFY